METKDFLSYKQQLKLLKNKKLIIDDSEFAIDMLKKLSYFNLINGYKKPFKYDSGDYKKGTHFENIYQLYCFDNTLRHAFMKYLLIVELHIKSLLSYNFCEEFGEAQSEYQNVLNYNYNGEEMQKRINDLIHILSNKINSSDKFNYVKHQEVTYQNIPLWVLVKTLTFGNISKMYTCQQPQIQSKISHEFENVNEQELAIMLDILTRYRNVCAHNERLYDFKYEKVQIKTNYIHRYFSLNNSRKKGSPLFDALIILKYLLSTNDFNGLVYDIDQGLKILSEQTNQIQTSQLLALMGFPQKWKDIMNLVEKHYINIS